MSSSISCLTLNDIKMNENGIAAVNSFLIKNQILEDLNLSNCQITDSHIKKLKYGLSFNTTLKVVYNKTLHF